jgi:hypothetical protein
MDGVREELNRIQKFGRVDLIVDACAKEDDQQNTALMWAARDGHEDIVRLLHEVHHADVNLTNAKGVTALMMAAAGGWLDCVDTMLRKADAANRDRALKCAEERQAAVTADEKPRYERVCALLLPSSAGAPPAGAPAAAASPVTGSSFNVSKPLERPPSFNGFSVPPPPGTGPAGLDAAKSPSAGPFGVNSASSPAAQLPAQPAPQPPQPPPAHSSEQLAPLVASLSGVLSGALKEALGQQAEPLAALVKEIGSLREERQASVDKAELQRMGTKVDVLEAASRDAARSGQALEQVEAKLSSATDKTVELTESLTQALISAGERERLAAEREEAAMRREEEVAARDASRGEQVARARSEGQQEGRERALEEHEAEMEELRRQLRQANLETQAVKAQLSEEQKHARSLKMALMSSGREGPTKVPATPPPPSGGPAASSEPSATEPVAPSSVGPSTRSSTAPWTHSIGISGGATPSSFARQRHAGSSNPMVSPALDVLDRFGEHAPTTPFSLNPKSLSKRGSTFYGLRGGS